MAENSAIEWTDATVNFWWGCTKVGPGCEHCYAETWSARFGGGIWGVGAPRRKIKGAVALIHRLDNDFSWWAADYHIGKMHATARRRVFIQSMSDLFDTEVPIEWFAEAWGRIEACSRLAIQIVTKRISVVEKRLAAIGRVTWPKHAGLMISVVNQEEADRDIPRLLALKAKLGIPWVGLSIEPLLGPIDLTCLDMNGDAEMDALSPREWSEEIDQWRDTSETWEADFEDWYGRWPGGLTGPIHPTLDWIIVGGESGTGARPMHPDWARSLRDQCEAAGVPFLFKQWGEWAQVFDRDREDPDWRNCGSWQDTHPRGRWHNLAGGTGFHGDRVIYVDKIGKRAAGRLLDGVEHNGLPDALSQENHSHG